MLKAELQLYAPKLSKLSKKYGEILQFVQELPPGRLEEVEGAVPHAVQNMSLWKDKLLGNHTNILVSGETAEDIATLIKEICGAAILDSDLLDTHTSLWICYSDKPHLILHRSESQVCDKVTLHHNTDVIFPKDDVKRYLKEKIDMIHIHWPLKSLQNGICLLVVPPSVRNRKEMTSCCSSCLPPPTGILYHVSRLPGNLQIQRMKMMITTLESVSRTVEDNRVITFDPKCILLVTDQHIMSGRISGLLPKVWKGVTGENLVTLDNMDSHMTQINQFCSSCLQGSLENAYRFLSVVLKRTFLTLKGNLSNLSDTSYNNRDLYESIMNSLVKVETKPDEIRKDIEMLKGNEISSTITKVSTFLTNHVTREKIMHWTETECPDIRGDMDHINATFLAKVLYKIREAINQWDSRLHVFENMQRRILDVFKTRFANIEGQLANIESNLLNGDAVYADGSQTDESDYVNMGFSFKFQAALAISSNVPFGDMLDHSSLMYLEEKLPQRPNPKEYIDYYQRNKVHEMREVTDIVLNGLMKDIGIKAILKDKLDNFLELLNGLVQNVPSLIQADKDMVENIMLGCEESDEKIHCIYWDKYSEAQTLTGELDYLYLSELRSYDIDATNVTSWGDVIAEGSYGKVQLATLQRSTEAVHVAVKMLKEELTEHNSTGFIAEEECLRHLQRPHIVKHYGTALQELHGAVYPLMLMEYCPTTLDMHIIGRDVRCPGRCPGDSDERREVEHWVARWAYQICSGLMSIHQMGYMHRDLKPKNILVDGAGDVKLADLGLAKLEQEVKNTYCGTPSYMAPEILKGSKYTKAADMYSFSMILCEIWMGNYVDYLYKLPLNEIERGIRERGLRPRLYPNGPQGTWKDVIETCWAENPRERYSSNYCCKVFSRLLKQ